MRRHQKHDKTVSQTVKRQLESQTIRSPFPTIADESCWTPRGQVAEVRRWVTGAVRALHNDDDIVQRVKAAEEAQAKKEAEMSPRGQE